MDLFHSRGIARAPMRWAGASMVAAILALSACGSGGSSTSGGATTPSASPTPLPPAGGQFTATGAIQLGTTVSATLVTCSFPSLNGSEITMQVATADQTEGGFITLTASRVYVRIGVGSGSTYTQRNFSGTGVTNFNAAKGAQFNSQLTDDTPTGQDKGTIGLITAISGSVSCGNKTPGGGAIIISGDSGGGAISGAITSMLVSCPAAATYALINGLIQVGSSMASLEIGGGSGEVYFASISTDSANYFFTSSATGLYTLSNGHVIWNHAVLTQSGAGGAGHKVTISGNATCGT